MPGASVGRGPNWKLLKSELLRLQRSVPGWRNRLSYPYGRVCCPLTGPTGRL